MRAKAYIYPNGNCLFFDFKGDQIANFQKHGLSGLHLFKDKYEDAEYFWCIWEVENRKISDINNLLKYIRLPNDN